MPTRTTLLISIALLELCLIGMLGLIDTGAFSESDTSNVQNSLPNSTATLSKYCNQLADSNHITPEHRGAYVSLCITGNQIQSISPLPDFNPNIGFTARLIHNVKALPFLDAILGLLLVTFFYILATNFPTINAGG